MIRLDTTTRTLEIILTTAQTTNPMACAVCYSDDSPGVSYTGGSKLTSSNGVTAATICLAPASGVTRDIDFISVYNADTAQKQATIRINDNGTFYSLIDVVMNVDDRLEYTHGSGWKLTDINGQTKQTFIGGSMTSAQLAAIITDETGTGSLVFSASPTFTGTVTAAAVNPTSINGVTTDSTTNKPVTAASLNGGTLPVSATVIRALSGSSIAGVASSDLAASQGTYQFGTSVDTYKIQGGPDYVGMIFNVPTTGNPNYIWKQGTTTFATLDINGYAATGYVRATTTIKTGGYTVATLPAGTTGDMAYVTDATAPTYLGALTGGGAVVCPVFKNATVWVSA